MQRLKYGFTASYDVLWCELITKAFVFSHEIGVRKSTHIRHDYHPFPSVLKARNTFWHTLNCSIAYIENTKSIQKKNIHLISKRIKVWQLLARAYQSRSWQAMAYALIAGKCFFDVQIIAPRTFAETHSEMTTAARITNSISET